MSSQPLSETSDQTVQHDEIVINKHTTTNLQKKATNTWFTAFKYAFPYYLAVHIAFAITTLFSLLFVLHDFSSNSLHFYTLWKAWARYDVAHFGYIALFGYTEWWRTAFFPLYPLLERSLFPLTKSPYVAGLIVSNIAGLVMLVVLYRLVAEDFGRKRALRTVLYLSVFPTAFFFAAAYNESVFVCFTLLSFYSLRRGRWWLAGLFGLLASLTRSVGILLLVPFAYEYLYQHQFNLRKIRFDVLSCVLIPTGMGLFAFYCYLKFNDALAFSHAQAVWSHIFVFPGKAYFLALQQIGMYPLLSFPALRNLLDLTQDLFMLLPVVLCFVGPWRMPRHLLSYSLYALVSYVFLQLFPLDHTFPLTSIPRYLLEIFPAFIVLAGMGKHRIFNLNYLFIAGALLFFCLLQFLTGHWMT